MARRPRALCRLEDVKRLLPNYQEPTDPTEQANADAFILDLIDSGSQRIHEVSGREFVALNDTGEVDANNVWPAPAAVVRSFDVVLNPVTPNDPAVGTRRARVLKIGDLASFTSLQYGDPWVPASRFAIAAQNVRAKPLNRAPWQPIRLLEVLGDVWSGQVYDVTGVWGFPQVPPDIRQACASQCAIWLGRDLRNFSQAFLEAAAAGGTASEPRALAQEVYDTAILYQIPDLG